MDKIILTNDNYGNFKNQDVIAFSFAGGGAMGDPCTLNIVNSNGDVFYANYRENIECKNIEEVCQPLKTFKVEIFHSLNSDENWIPIYLGYGNHLQIKKTISDEFEAIVQKQLVENEIFFLYRNWISIAVSIAKAKQ